MRENTSSADPAMQPLDAATFEKNWETLDEAEKKSVIETSADLPPSRAVLPIIEGIGSYHYSLRNRAREALEAVKEKITALLAESEDEKAYRSALTESDLFCSRIYREIRSGVPVSEAALYFKTMTEAGGMGPFYAWKLLYTGLIPAGKLGVMVDKVSAPGRLALVAQYVESRPPVRKRWANEFKRIIRGINDEAAAIEFFAALFDMKSGYDPFYRNLPVLQDPDVLVSKMARTGDTAEKKRLIKALFMLKDAMDPVFLKNFLGEDTDKEIRLTVLTVMAASDVRAYPGLEEILFDILLSRGTDEAVLAFKALVIQMAPPLYRLFEKIQTGRQEIIPSLLQEIAVPSRTALMIIQDMAFHRRIYSRLSTGIEKRLLLCLVCRKPEWVHNMLKKHETCSDDTLRLSVINFRRMIGDFFLQEKQRFQAECDALSAGASDTGSTEKQGFFKKIFTSSLEKKLAELKAHPHSKKFDFEGEVIDGTDLSSSNVSSAVCFFNNCVIKNSDFSKSRCLNSFFKSSVVCNVNLHKARFDSVDFSNSVFVNVYADEASFVNCSFQGAAFYNSSFKNTLMTDTVFTGAKLFKTSFKNADLSGASFTMARLAYVSFADAALNMTNFTGARAKFLKFSTMAEHRLITRGCDFEERSFAADIDEIPAFTDDIFSRVFFLTLVAFIPYSENQFLRKNQFSEIMAFDVFRPLQAELYELVPYLLHENVSFPGFDVSDDRYGNCPFGIAGYVPSPETEATAGKYLGGQTAADSKTDFPYIEGLYTIGSTGSMSQTTESDFDYWVCIDSDYFTARKKTRLTEKLSLLEKWAAETFAARLNFFIVDIHKVLNNDFGELTFESSGTAQARILKEEFYRTMIHVAGKIPLWCILPVDVSKNYYNEISHLIRSSHLQSRYIDLGDLHGIPSGEFFGASIWQMYKVLNSPFKSVIKMGLLEKFIYEYGKEPLLCNIAKDFWINAGTRFKLTRWDPYYLLMRNLIRFYRSIGDRESVTLIQVCFFLKLRLKAAPELKDTVFGLRGLLVERCVREWHMDQDRIYEIGNFRQWHYKNIKKLSVTIEKYMINKLKKINSTFESFFQKVSRITPEERTVLLRKIFVEFSKRPGKIEKSLLVSGKNIQLHNMSLKYVKTEHKVRWELVNRPGREALTRKESLHVSATVEEIAAWMIKNDFFGVDTVVSLVPNPSYVTFDDIRHLFIKMNEFFLPELQEKKSFESLLAPSKIVSVFISFNFYAARSIDYITHFSAVYLNSWGEMFIKTVEKKSGFHSVAAVEENLRGKLGLTRMPEKTMCFLPGSFVGQVKKWEAFLS